MCVCVHVTRQEDRVCCCVCCVYSYNTERSSVSRVSRVSSGAREGWLASFAIGCASSPLLSPRLLSLCTPCILCYCCILPPLSSSLRFSLHPATGLRCLYPLSYFIVLLFIVPGTNSGTCLYMLVLYKRTVLTLSLDAVLCEPFQQGKPDTN